MSYLGRIYTGRINRRTYVLGLLLLISTFGACLALLLSTENTLSLVAASIIAIAYFIYIFSLHTRRFHDMGKDGNHSFLLFIPLVNFAMICILILQKGDMETNKYGARVGKIPFFKTIFQGFEEHVSDMHPGLNHKFCSNCGNSIDDDSKFCIHCGNKIQN